jgi:predicted  nucleic acid-binding Zn-ribbon protein
VAGARKDGAPNLSHAWARTVDGAQGGTWEACHLLGSSALDAYRGYTGQSRSRQPTHTWNTARVAVVDHGGALADQRDGAEQVADALSRQPDPSMAARSDPWALDRQLHQLIAEHERALSARPPDRQDALAGAVDEMRSVSAWLESMDAAAAHSGRQLDQLGHLAGWSRNGRDHRQFLHDKLEGDTRRAAAARERHEETAGRVERLRQDQDAYEHFETAEGWRRADLVSLHHQVDRHWAEVVAACVWADDPLAYGIDKLRHARSTLERHRRAIDAAVPEDRGDQWDQAHRQLADVVSQHHQAEKLLAAGQARLEDVGRRRWGRHDQKAVADAQAQLAAVERRAQQATNAERHLRERLAALAEHQQQRQDHLADVAVPRQAIGTNLAQVDAALDRTRPDRVAALAEGPPDHLVRRIGAPPGTPAGRAVWCHHALDIEAALDRNDGASPPWTGLDGAHRPTWPSTSTPGHCVRPVRSWEHAASFGERVCQRPVARGRGRFGDRECSRPELSDLLGPITKGVVMRRYIAIIAAAVAMAVVPFTVLQVTTAGAQTKTAGAITMHAWLHAVPSTNGLSATVYECAKITGAIVDQGGDPTWNDSNYATMSSPASKCGNYEPVGGYVMVPPPSGANNTLTTFYAVHTLTLQKGQIFITYAGTYNLTGTESDGVPPYQTGPDTTWDITGGTGAYAGLQGEGTCSANASLFPYIVHTGTGKVWWAEQS